MKAYMLSKGKIAELEKFHRSLRDKRQAGCVKAIIALPKGWSTAQIKKGQEKELKAANRSGIITGALASTTRTQ